MALLKSWFDLSSRFSRRDIAPAPAIVEAPIEDPPIMGRYRDLDPGFQNHASGAFSTDTLCGIERHLRSMEFSAETGCGKSTILFSNYSEHHLVFTLDDRFKEDQSSVLFYQQSPLTISDKIDAIFGPTQKTLTIHKFDKGLDLVLIDGPHGYPFPELEYFYFYPHIKTGGLLIIDDVHLPTVGRLADFVAEDDMFEFVEMIEMTALFKRTDAPMFDPFGDGWWEQKYNRRRISSKRSHFLASENPVSDRFTSQGLDKKFTV